jgi:hypothetical protein
MDQYSFVFRILMYGGEESVVGSDQQTNKQTNKQIYNRYMDWLILNEEDNAFIILVGGEEE